MCRGQPEVCPKDHYQILDVKRNATLKDIASAYKSLALRFHPDKNPENKAQAEAVFHQAADAYETLRDPARRRMYDLQLSEFGGMGTNGIARNEGDVFHMYMDRRCGASPTGGLCGGLGGSGFAGAFDLESLLRAPAGGNPGVKRAAPRPPVCDLAHAVPRGAAVVLHGLVDAAVHNGKEAEVRAWDDQRGRYEVRFCDGGLLSLRPRNITQTCHAEIAHFRRAPGLNGQQAQIHDYDVSKEQYVVSVNESPLTMNMPLANCVLPPGTRVLTRGLSDEKLNEKMAQITYIDRDNERYVICCQDGRQLKVAFDKVLC